MESDYAEMTILYINSAAVLSNSARHRNKYTCRPNCCFFLAGHFDDVEIPKKVFIEEPSLLDPHLRFNVAEDDYRDILDGEFSFRTFYRLKFFRQPSDL